MKFRRKRDEPWEFHDLAIYNSERARGIVHTPEYDALMAEKQAAFDGWMRDRDDAPGGGIIWGSSTTTNL